MENVCVYLFDNVLLNMALLRFVVVALADVVLTAAVRSQLAVLVVVVFTATVHIQLDVFLYCLERGSAILAQAALPDQVAVDAVDGMAAHTQADVAGKKLLIIKNILEFELKKQIVLKII